MQQKNSGSLCSFYLVAQGQSQTLSNIELHWNTFKEAHEPAHSVAALIPHQSMTQLAPKMTLQKADFGKHQTLLGQIQLLTLWSTP